MFSVQEKRDISEAVQLILRRSGHVELPSGEISFELHVHGASPMSWAIIANNGKVPEPNINPFNEAQALKSAPTPTPEPPKVLADAREAWPKISSYAISGLHEYSMSKDEEDIFWKAHKKIDIALITERKGENKEDGS